MNFFSAVRIGKMFKERHLSLYPRGMGHPVVMSFRDNTLSSLIVAGKGYNNIDLWAKMLADVFTSFEAEEVIALLDGAVVPKNSHISLEQLKNQKFIEREIKCGNPDISFAITVLFASKAEVKCNLLPYKTDPFFQWIDRTPYNLTTIETKIENLGTAITTNLPVVDEYLKEHPDKIETRPILVQEAIEMTTEGLKKQGCSALHFSL